MKQVHSILKLLMDGNWHSVNEINHELYISQYNSRIYDLRKLGFEIENSEYKHIPKYDKVEIRARVLHEPPPKLTFFKLLTPNNRIDFESLTVKPLENHEQMELL